MVECDCCHCDDDGADDREEGYGREPVHVAKLPGQVQYEAQYRARSEEHDGAGSVVGEDVHLLLH